MSEKGWCLKTCAGTFLNLNVGRERIDDDDKEEEDTVEVPDIFFS